jgi:hypothetical protein
MWRCGSALAHHGPVASGKGVTRCIGLVLRLIDIFVSYRLCRDPDGPSDVWRIGCIIPLIDERSARAPTGCWGSLFRSLLLVSVVVLSLHMAGGGKQQRCRNGASLPHGRAIPLFPVSHVLSSSR